jgi:transposase
MSRPKGSADLLEDRRQRALALLKVGLSFNEVGRRIRCAASSAMRWFNTWRRGGDEALKVRSSPGRPVKLGRVQLRRLVRLLLKGPLAYGYRTNLWTTARIAEVIQREFGVHYHRDHIGRLMHRLDWSHQKPETRAIERDEKAIARWKQKDWPRVKKTPRGWAPISSSPTNPDSC